MSAKATRNGSSNSNDKNSETASLMTISDAMRRFGRSVELCDDYLRGFYGLKIVRISCNLPSIKKLFLYRIDHIITDNTKYYRHLRKITRPGIFGRNSDIKGNGPRWRLGCGAAATTTTNEKICAGTKSAGDSEASRDRETECWAREGMGRV